MTMYTVKTNPSEAEAIMNGNKMFVFRADAPHFAVGNNIQFAVVDSRRMTPHPIEERVYKITHIDRGEPIEEGILAIGFKPAK